MIITKKCLICGKDYEVPHWRDKSSKYCSVTCQRESLRAKPNMICAICGKPFHSKQSHIDKCKRDLGLCCSKECLREQRRIRMSGEKNHQYGLKGHLNASFKKGNLLTRNNNLVEIMYYVGNWYKKSNENGRVKYHRYLVELNHDLYDANFFEKIDNWYYLKEGYVVHHIDFNHNNNDISNLQIVTKGEHTRIHNLANPRKRNSKNGQFIK